MSQYLVLTTDDKGKRHVAAKGDVGKHLSKLYTVIQKKLISEHEIGVN